MPSSEIIFHKKGRRPKELTVSEAHQAKLDAKRRWRKKNKERIALYNEMYNKKQSKKHSHNCLRIIQ